MRLALLALLVAVAVSGYTATATRAPRTQKRRVRAIPLSEKTPRDYNGPGYSFGTEDFED